MTRTYRIVAFFVLVSALLASLFIRRAFGSPIIKYASVVILTSDPSTGSGYQAAKGVIAVDSTTGIAYMKTGAGATAWTSIVTSSSGVPTTRTLTAGTGLSGGGDLSANRTFTLSMAGASCSAGQAITSLSATGTGTCSAISTTPSSNSTGLSGACAFDGTSVACGMTPSGSPGVYTMTGDLSPTSMAFSNGAILKTNNWRVFDQGGITGTAIFDCNGGDASGATGGAAVAAGFYGASTAGENGKLNGSQVGGASSSNSVANWPGSSTNSTSNAGSAGNNPGTIGQAPGKGGGGGGSSGNTPGPGGTVTLLTTNAVDPKMGVYEYVRARTYSVATVMTGASGGGGGAGTGATAQGGSGGGGACSMYVEAQTISGNVTFRANGGAASAATCGGGETSGGGGGGGGGNVGVVVHGKVTGGATVQANGGAHSAGCGGGGVGGDGAAGTAWITQGA